LRLRHLKTLVAIADYGGFAAAGEAIGLIQSAVSLHVKALEDGFGASLFDRSKRPPLLNARGTDVVERAREIVRLCADLGDTLAGADVAGVLELGATPTALTGALPGANPRAHFVRALHGILLEQCAVEPK
jgi:DNA-binding transcriptional LysR family regulator